MSRLGAACALAAFLAPIAAVAQTLTVVGLGGQSATLTPKDFADLPREAVVSAGTPGVHYDGVPLTAILRMVGAPAGPTLHGKAVKDFVVVTGVDGFAAVLSLAETDAALHKGAVIIADNADGKPLADHEGPYRLVIDGDLKSFRSVRHVARIELKAAP